MAPRHTLQRLNKSCILLTAIGGMERFAFKGVASNLVTYLSDVVKMSNSSAAKMVNSWCGFTSIMPLLVAPIADAYCHKYSTIMATSFLYLLGLAALTSTAVARSYSFPDGNKTIPSSFLSWSLYLISLGQGGYNPSLQAFGADQLDGDDDDDGDDEDNDEELPYTKKPNKPNKKTVFFQWWYFGICSGSLLGVTVMSYIQDTFGWVLGFAIPAISMAASILIFSCGSPIYRYRDGKSKAKKKPLFNMVRSIIKTCAFKCFRCEITLPKDQSQVNEMELQEKPLCTHDQTMDNLKDLNENNPKTNSHNILANSKLVLRLFPIWTLLLMFAVIFQQPSTFFTKQGMTMKRNVGENFKIPPATLQSAITLSIMLLMPLYDKIFIPMAHMVTGQEKGINVMQRMGIGMVLSVIAMVIAALVETKRLEIGRKMMGNSSSSGENVVPLSIFWLLPQYILLGISDIFTVVGMQEFFYSEVPVSMRTLGIALYTSVFGVGSFVSAVLISVVEVLTSSEGEGRHGWFSDDMINEARLDNYYWLLAFLSAVSLVLYVLLSKYYYHHRSSDSDCES